MNKQALKRTVLQILCFTLLITSIIALGKFAMLMLAAIAIGAVLWAVVYSMYQVNSSLLEDKEQEERFKLVMLELKDKTDKMI